MGVHALWTAHCDGVEGEHAPDCRRWDYKADSKAESITVSRRRGWVIENRGRTALSPECARLSRERTPASTEGGRA